MKSLALAGSVAILGMVLPQAAKSDETALDRWFELLGPQGQRIGYQHEYERVTPTGREVVRERQLAFHIDGHPETRSRALLVRGYDAAGNPVGFRSEWSQAKARTVVTGMVAGQTLRLERDSNGRKTERTSDLPADFALGDSLAAAMPTQPFYELAPGSSALIRLEPLALGGARTILYDGRLFAVDFVTEGDTQNPQRIAVPQLGYDLELRAAKRPLGPPNLAQAQRLPHEMMPAPFYVDRSALGGHIRYLFAIRGGVPIEIPETGEQAVRSDGGARRVDLCGNCGPGLPHDTGSLMRWTAPSPWIESNAETFRNVASKARGHDDRARMLALGRTARERLSGIDYEGHVSASAAWRRRSGDCTEDAVVLAALARAAGIPARVANGLVYSRTRYHGAANAFLPHSWVVAWADGRWQSFDISLAGFDASHIALSIGDGEPASIIEASRIAALLEWREMAEIRTR